MFEGVFTAVITPFKDGKIDYTAYFKILDSQIGSGVAGIVPCGTTGESPTLDYEEHLELIQKTVSYVNHKIQVIAGTGSNSTKEAIYLTEEACKAGVDGVLSVNPYYNKPTQEGLFQHFNLIANASEKPVMLYNIPGRTSVNLSVDTIKRLSENPKITSIKEATGDLGQMAKTIQAVGSKMTVLSGDDGLTLPLLSIGGKGVVSVISNLFPKTMARMVKLFTGGEIEASRKIYYDFLSLFGLAFCETNPIPVKAGMHLLGYCENTLRLPLTPLSNSSQADEFKKQIFHLRGNGYE
ncbi:MAG TPA: 4-hydroxy-tetrahydrodipicolinate synthase [Leptospiraceae bacterium]|nr:4-hydroxy-tetrahydrodipicolinate synthase [Leptospiraceae bacterium]HMW06714.1 4-hydroxy-tetrahydrodipicolinate synthase [Leptospiraceae bacterium]HMX34637.1 4-hydroxy-tetrahydrodipicolinate synthase [Leptospiraceae bacterium]HMY32020.1 4-hydroxy-tetrahydrodipicolinate synthase [Leptospiraceae bacterium]HMZ66245.1 4-hydroxy-tetrahydrodipicolinate synthase [Leptospiraceae bacterium]